ncbi:TPA: sugar phosphate isomerase/epimerase [Candidatus Poribacteria bacterium]|nr:sugar phosphate isomerase/epimerase [Candidatus Poribacteria bacterium]
MKLATMANVSRELEFREDIEFYPRISYRGISDEVKKLKSMRFHGAQVDLDFVPGDEDCRKIRAEFSEGGIEIAALSGYNWSDRNLAEPDEQKREKNVNFLKSKIEIAKKIGAKAVITWGGFKECPENTSQLVIESLKEACVCAEENDVYIALELYDECIVGTPDQILEAIDKVGSKFLKVVMDPPNVMKEIDLKRMDAFLDETVSKLADYIAIAHAKDVLFKNGERSLPGAGEGQMDYSSYIKALRKAKYDYFLVIEHVSGNTVEAARDYVQKALTSYF